MTARPVVAAVALALGGLLLSACGQTAAGAGPSSSSASTSGAGAAVSTSSAAASRSSAPAAPTTSETATEAADLAGAPAQAAMVCSDEVRGDIAKLLALPTRPTGHATWADQRFTCTYHLPVGQLVLSVQESATDAAARGHLAGLRVATTGSRPITGLASLGLPAFENTTGTAAFVKDNFTLVVDATGLHGTLGQPGVTRTDFAYALATDVLACWSS